ncbi:MAG TPA: response regulator transcription factor [Phycisphaerae bacterium]|jgi:two-component system phosphate regulon response regulator PhoB|nr:response regulator transcription factor [Phycisphaerae bacterium]HOJ54797.1 response regulator transcription factor [Phycisphaerae bacterium]HOL26925.1 response regulator transcription factor [Phycisphaerae bacterium]HPP20880.1 response regulator transcription factor [Phycisphaerae bacterium]HPU33113.1 response regulator transcription factor [Phycisphaerae bacterium]
MSTRKSILIVEDEADLANLVRHHLEQEGYECRTAFDGPTALAEARHRAPDLILLDRMLPGLSGDEVLSQIRHEHRGANIPVIMLTAKADETDQLVGFALGADDYVPKPFSMKLLLARVAALLRRAEAGKKDPEVLSVGPITLDAGRYEVTVAGRPVMLTTTEFRLLRALMAANGRVLSRSQMIDSVLGTGVAVTDRTIDVHITAVRKKLLQAGGWIQTIRGVGYAFRKPDED